MTELSADSSATLMPAEAASPSPPRYATLAEGHYPGPVKYLFNAPRTYVICLDQSRFRMPVGPGMVTPGLRFFVYDLHADEIVFEDAVDNARVHWESDTSLKVAITPGTVPELESREFGYRFDVVTRTREEL